MDIPFYSIDPAFRIYPIRGIAGSFHLLHSVEQREVILIDTGLIGELTRLGNLLHKIGFGWTDLRTILLTHGHLDHTGNLARIKELSGASVMAHPLEQAHIKGTFPYRGASRVCGGMEAIGRCLFSYQTTSIDRPLEPDTELPYWGGLRVLHLPGHTAGHCGFFSSRFDLLFSGDLFASYWFSVHPPPSFLNSCPEKFEASFEMVEKLNPSRLIPNHYDALDGELHRRRLESLRKRNRG